MVAWDILMVASGQLYCGKGIGGEEVPVAGYGRFEEEKNFLPLMGSNHDSSAFYSVG